MATHQVTMYDQPAAMMFFSLINNNQVCAYKKNNRGFRPKNALFPPLGVQEDDTGDKVGNFCHRIMEDKQIGSSLSR